MIKNHPQASLLRDYKRIMIVDDEPFNILGLKTMMQ